jgi:PTH1 family peptidyl-tRNA hydrolase
MLLEQKLHPSWKKWKSLGDYAEIKLGAVDTWFCVRPLTYMNESGRLVKDFANFHKIGPQDIVICFDDWAIPVGSIRVRPRGSSGGHNGMQSVIDHLGTQEIPRVRIGIGPLPSGRDSVEFVLSSFSKSENNALIHGLDLAYSAISDLAAQGIEFAMNRYNAAEAVKEDP